MATSIVVSTLIILGFAIPAVFRKARETFLARKEALRQLMLSKGWRLDESVGASVLAVDGTTDGVSWRIVSQSDGQHSSSTVWTSNDVTFPELMAVIRSRNTLKLVTGRFSKMIKLSSKAPPNAFDIGDLQNNGVELTYVSQKKLAVIVRRGAGFETFVTRELDQALNTWFAQSGNQAFLQTLCVDVGRPNVAVFCSYRVKPEQLAALVAIGVQAVRAAKKDF
jgi:hypothetical protein